VTLSLLTPLDFYPKHLNHAFTLTLVFEGYRRNAKEPHEKSTDQFEANPEFLNEDLRQMPDNPNTFRKTIKAWATGWHSIPVLN
jgi:hypothetical protein